MRLRPLLFVLALAPALAHADEFDGNPTLSTDDKAAIEADRDAAHKAIDEKYKGDDSADARRARSDAYRDADREVLEKKGLNQKDYLWQNSHNSPDQQAEIKEKKKGLEEKRKEEAKAKAEKEKSATEAGPEVVKGFNDQNPLDLSAEPKAKKEPKLDENGNAMPEVEKASPEDDAAAGGSGPAPVDAAAAGGGKRHGKKHRGGE